MKGSDEIMNLTLKNELLANDIKEFIMSNDLGMDVRIYFNNKCYDWYGKNYLREPSLIDGIKPSDYFEYANDDTVSISFEGLLYDIINYSKNNKLLEKFNNIFEKHNCYYEFGNSWNLSVYYN